MLRVYDLQPACVRLDSTTASGHWTVTEHGWFPFGHSKDHRPNLPPVKVMRSLLDPLGLPVATDVVPGQRADDPLYMPAILRVRESLGRRGLLDVGDGKMGAVEARAFIQAGGATYLCPLSANHIPSEGLEGYLAPVWLGRQPLTRITRVAAGGTRACIADGYELLEPMTVVVAGQAVTWVERRLVVCSRPLARAGEAALRARLVQAQATVAALNDWGRGKPRFLERPALEEAVEAILTPYRVQGLAGRARYRTHTGSPAAARWQPAGDGLRGA